MTHKKYKIKDKFVSQKYIKFELNGSVEFRDKKQNFIFCSNEHPFVGYQVGETIEINLTSAKLMDSNDYHQTLLRNTFHYNDYNVSQEGNVGGWQGSQQLQTQEQMSAYQKEVAYKKFQSAIKWLEKFIEIVYGEQFPDWENRKQFRENGIPRKDIIGDPKRTEKLFTFSLYSLEGCTDHPELQAKMKEEFYQWISATKVDVNNCPDKLKYYLFGFNEILEGRGEKIVAEGDNRKDTFDVDSPEYAKALNSFFSSLHSGPMQEAKEREHSLKDKKYSDLEVGSSFSGNEEEGKSTLQRIRDYVSSSLSYQDFHFFPQKGQKIRNPNYNPLIDDPSEEFLSSSISQSSNPPQPNNSQIIQEVKTNPENWRLDEIITGLGDDETKQEFVLVHKDAREDYDQQGKLNFNNNPIYRWESFNVQQRFEIKQVKGISGDYLTADEIKWVIREFKDNPGFWGIKEIQGRNWLVHNSAQTKNDEIGTLIHSQQKFSKAEWTEIDATLAKVNNIKQNAKLEKVFVINKETGEKSEGEDWFIHSQLERKFDDETGYLIYDSNAMIRAKDLSRGEQRAVGYKLEQEQVQHQDNRPRGGSGWLGGIHKANIYVAGSTMIISLIGLAFVK